MKVLILVKGALMKGALMTGSFVLVFLFVPVNSRYGIPLISD